MELNKQVCSLELSNKLKELGVKQESIFCWEDDSDAEYLITRAEANREGKEWSESCPSSFTVAELGDLFPVNVQLPFKKDELAQEYWYWSSEKGRHREYTEADARAKMLIYLLENNLITNQ